MSAKYRVTGVIEVEINASSPEEAQKIAESKLWALLDRHARRLNANIGLDNVTKGDDARNLLRDEP